MSSYDLVHQLWKKLAQISIFELLELSPLHKEILEKALRVASVPRNLDPNKFHEMVSHISTPHYLSFFEEDDKSLSHLHNLALYIKVQIYHTWVHRVLIENCAELNIVSFHVVQQPRLSEFTIDPRHKIAIKAYDEVESSFKGLIFLPIQVGPIEKDIVF